MPMNSLSTFARRSAVGGVVVWLLLLLADTTDSRETELIHKIVFFAVLVVVPLGLSLVAASNYQQGLSFLRLAVFGQPLAALASIASFFLEFGKLAALLSSAWLIITGLISLFGIMRVKSRGLNSAYELSIDAGLLYLPVAGFWLVVYRLGVQPFDYGETIILLTVVHFHFAGFAAPIIAGMNGKVLDQVEHPRKMFAASVFAIIAAMPLVAAGITASPWLGVIGTILLSAGLVMLAVLTVGWVIPAITPFGRQLLLLVGASSSCAAMVLACLYAYSLASKTLIIDIPTMAMTHGLMNCFGFVTCSLIAWTTMAPESAAANSQTVATAR